MVQKLTVIKCIFFGTFKCLHYIVISLQGLSFQPQKPQANVPAGHPLVSGNNTLPTIDPGGWSPGIRYSAPVGQLTGERRRLPLWVD